MYAYREVLRGLVGSNAYIEAREVPTTANTP